jgi:hypothetical protein
MIGIWRIMPGAAREVLRAIHAISRLEGKRADVTAAGFN